MYQPFSYLHFVAEVNLESLIIENTFLLDSYASEDSDVLDSAAVTLRAVMITAVNTL